MVQGAADTKRWLYFRGTVSRKKYGVALDMQDNGPRAGITIFDNPYLVKGTVSRNFRSFFWSKKLYLGPK